MNGMLNERINELKGSIHALWDKMRKNEDDVSLTSEEMDTDNFKNNFEDDMPLRLAREDGPGVRYYTTENNPMSIGAEKVEAAGIDSFGEDDSIDPEQEEPFTHGV